MRTLTVETPGHPSWTVEVAEHPVLDGYRLAILSYPGREPAWGLVYAIGEDIDLTWMAYNVTMVNPVDVAARGEGWTFHSGGDIWVSAYNMIAAFRELGVI